ncbi:MAG: HAD family phosphatase, partial [Eubacteriales bacterium]|nr:HAD family phosphatase [Eubacteriales bacterium]
MIQAALFDMDGVLFDTEVLGFQAMKQLSAEKGYAIDQAFYETTLGVPNAECGGIYRKALGEAFPYEEVIARFRDFFLDYVRTRPLPFKPGLVDCLSGLRERGVKIALATSTVRQLVTKYFAVMPEIGAYFDGIVCGGEVPNGKPAPDIYIAAARSVG